MKDKPVSPGSTLPYNAPPAFHILVKPTGAVCNLDCKYCFFLSKEMLYSGSRFRMSQELLELYLSQLLESHQAPEIAVAWQGGEPTLMGLDFFRKSVEMVERFRKPSQSVQYTIQTNGTKIDEDWAAFFKQHSFLVGLSMDGPRALHDAYRVNKGGQGSFDLVMRGWEYLVKYEVEYNILCTVHAANADHPMEVYHFFRDELKAQFVQFIPIVERCTPEMLPLANRGWGIEGALSPGGTLKHLHSGERPLYTQTGEVATERSVKPEQYGRFLITIFDEWVLRDVGKVFVQSFDAALASWMGQPTLCIFQPACGNALALEHNGDLYSCDHYVEPAFLLGNISETDLIAMVASEPQRKFGKDKYDSLPQYCRECDVLFACYGECPRNRFIKAPDGEPGLNYLCPGYKLFFHHVDRPMRLMVDLLRHGRYADEVMNILAMEEMQKLKQALSQANPDDLCPCGSGKKFGLCHGRKRRKQQ